MKLNKSKCCCLKKYVLLFPNFPPAFIVSFSCCSELLFVSFSLLAVTNS